MADNVISKKIVDFLLNDSGNGAAEIEDGENIRYSRGTKRPEGNTVVARLTKTNDDGMRARILIIEIDTNYRVVSFEINSNTYFQDYRPCREITTLTKMRFIETHGYWPLVELFPEEEYFVIEPETGVQSVIDFCKSSRCKPGSYKSDNEKAFAVFKVLIGQDIFIANGHLAIISDDELVIKTVPAF
jgi:hypothetical protein